MKIKEQKENKNKAKNLMHMHTFFIHLCLLWPDRQTDRQNIHKIDESS